MSVKLDNVSHQRTNEDLATWLRAIHKLREASWDNGEEGSPHSARYTKTTTDCVFDVVGSNPIGVILIILYDTGYSDLWDFCEDVLGPEA